MMKLERSSSEHKDWVLCIQSGNDLQPQLVFRALKPVYPIKFHDHTTIKCTLDRPFQLYTNAPCCGKKWANSRQNELQLWLRTCGFVWFPLQMSQYLTSYWMWLMQLPLCTIQNPISATIGKSAHHTRPDDHCLPPSVIYHQVQNFNL